MSVRPRRRHAGEFRMAQLCIVLVLVFLVMNSPRLAIGTYEVKGTVREKLKGV